MSKFKRTITTLFLVIDALALTSWCSVSAKVSTLQQTPPCARRRQADDADYQSDFPVVDYERPEPSDPTERAKRRLRGRAYDKSGFVPSPEHAGTLSGVSFNSEWDFHVEALPVAQSDAILIGEVLKAEAYLSQNKRGVYSEFTVGLKEILKGNEQSKLELGSNFIAHREGGWVRYPAGQRLMIEIAGQRMPRVGRRYLLFLNKAEGEHYTILAGYELREGCVLFLDGVGKGLEYSGQEETTFLGQVKEAIAKQGSRAP